MMEMIHEMMGMMKGTVQEEEDREKLEGMMQHMERMMAGYDKAMKDTEGKMTVEAKESGALTKMAGDGMDSFIQCWVPMQPISYASTPNGIS